MIALAALVQYYKTMLCGKSIVNRVTIKTLYTILYNEWQHKTTYSKFKPTLKFSQNTNVSNVNVSNDNFRLS